MKVEHRIALIYAVATAGAAGISYYRERDTKDILFEALFHGAAAGTALNVVTWLALEGPSEEQEAMANSGLEFLGNAGRLGVRGVQIAKALSDLDVDKLYAASKENGVKIGPVPLNPNSVNQDQD